MIYKVHNAEFTQWAFFENTKYHAVLCDPPYGIAFMGKKWDDLGGPAAFQAQVTCWGESLKPLLYPGALVFMFGGTRMWHRMAAGMEDAGFHLWDTLMWLYGQGFPKAQDISKLIDKAKGTEREVIGVGTSGKNRNVLNAALYPESFGGDYTITAPGSELSAPWGGYKTPQLKPAWEPVLCFRAPNDGMKYAELALEHGSGALNVDGARIGNDLVGWGGKGREQGRTYEGGWGVGEPRPVEGRYPANVAFECTCEEIQTVETTETCKADEDGDTPNYKNKVYGKGMGGVKWTGTRPVSVVVHTNPTCPAFVLDAQSGTTKSHPSGPNTEESSSALYGWSRGGIHKSGVHFGDSGGASRFFYVAKASRSEREAGLDAFEPQAFGMSNQAKAEVKRGTTEFENSELGVNSVKKVRNNHPTVKPIELNRWLATLLLPPESVEPRRILVPFAGAGSEMIGCLRAGWDEVVGVELMEEYCKIAEARLVHWSV